MNRQPWTAVRRDGAKRFAAAGSSGFKRAQATQPAQLRIPFSVEEGASRYVVTSRRMIIESAHASPFDHPAIGDQYASIRHQTRILSLTLWLQQGHSALPVGRNLSGPEGFALGSTAWEHDRSCPTSRHPSRLPDLRFPDEFVRHKILDMVGDLALVGARLQAHIIGERPGHRGNVALARRLQQLRSKPADGRPVLDCSAIMSHLPHRYPFLLVDRVLEYESEKRILAIKNVTINEPFFQGHFPGHPIMPGVLIVEAMAQAGGLLLMDRLDAQNQVVYFLGLDDVRFRRPVLPGDQLGA